jgi:hypothetical protein
VERALQQWARYHDAMTLRISSYVIATLGHNRPNAAGGNGPQLPRFELTVNVNGEDIAIETGLPHIRTT